MNPILKEPFFRRRNTQPGRRLLACAAGAALLLAAPAGAVAQSPTASGPLAWDIRFTPEEAGKTPPIDSPYDDAMVAMLKRDGTLPVPFTSFGSLTYVLPTRTLTVQQDPNGLKGLAAVFDVPSNDPGYTIGKSRGPIAAINVPITMYATRQWLLSFDIAAGEVMNCGTLQGWAQGRTTFYLCFRPDGRIHDESEYANRIDVAPYTPNKPMHFDVLIDNEQRTTTLTIDHDADSAITYDWAGDPTRKTVFSSLEVAAMEPGHGGSGRMAINNLRLQAVDGAPAK